MTKLFAFLLVPICIWLGAFMYMAGQTRNKKATAIGIVVIMAVVLMHVRVLESL